MPNPKVMFGAFEPDKPPHLHHGISDMANAYPRASGYSPMGAFVPITDALPQAYNGGASYVASDGTGSLLAGGGDALYEFVSGSWTSLTSGLSGTDPFRFTQFGDQVIAVNGGETQVIDLLTSTAGPLGGDPPTATSVATVRDFVVYGEADGNQALVQWSGFNDATSNTPGTNQAGFQPMLEGGAVMGTVGGEYGIIVQRGRVVRMTYTGDDTTFQFDAIAREVGAVSKGSIAATDRRIYFLSDRGFVYCDGNTITPIGFERVDKAFLAENPVSTLGAMSSAIDPRRYVVAWLMPGNPGRLWMYDWGLDRWAKAEIDAKAIFSGFTANITLEQLDALYPSGLDSMPYSLDDPRFAGGDPLFLFVRNDDTIGALTGENIAAWFETPFVEMVDRRRTRLRAVVPIGDAVDGLSVTLDCRQRLGDRPVPQVRGTLQRSGMMPVRANGIYVKSRLDLAAGAEWTYAQGLEFIPAVGGAR